MVGKFVSRNEVRYRLGDKIECSLIYFISFSLSLSIAFMRRERSENARLGASRRHVNEHYSSRQRFLDLISQGLSNYFDVFYQVLRFSSQNRRREQTKNIF